MKNRLNAFLHAGILLCICHPAFSLELNVSVLDQDSNAVEDAVITVSGNTASNKIPNKSKDYIIDQIDKTFVPGIITIPVGSRVNFPNKDNIRHHVYSFSEAKKFELPLYEGTPANPVSFDKPGIVVLGCNIHDWMRGYIFITDAAQFLQTGKSGQVEFSQLDKGTYKIQVWHPELESDYPVTETIKLDSNTQKIFNITLKPAIMIRRAPKQRRKGY